MNLDRYEKKLELQLFIDIENGFNEKDSVRVRHEKDRRKYEFDISTFKHIKIFRLDPLNESCVISIENAYIEDKNGNVYKLRFLFTNADIFENMFYFNSKDPQIFFDLGNKQIQESEFLELYKAVFEITFYYINF